MASDRLSAAKLIEAVHEAGGAIALAGDRIHLSAAAPLPDNLVEAIRASRDQVIQVLRPARSKTPDSHTPAAWRVWYRARIQHHKRLGRNDILAGALAWGEAENIWHQRHGASPDPSKCAGCGELLSGRERLTLGDGAVVHWDEGAGLDCLGSYGRRWRSEATAGLVALGLEPPDETSTEYNLRDRS